MAFTVRKTNSSPSSSLAILLLPRPIIFNDNQTFLDIVKTIATFKQIKLLENHGQLTTKIRISSWLIWEKSTLKLSIWIVPLSGFQVVQTTKKGWFPAPNEPIKATYSPFGYPSSDDSVCLKSFKFEILLTKVSFHICRTLYPALEIAIFLSMKRREFQFRWWLPNKQGYGDETLKIAIIGSTQNLSLGKDLHNTALKARDVPLVKPIRG